MVDMTPDPACRLEDDLRRADVQLPRLSPVFDVVIPAAVLAVLAAAGAVGALAGDVRPLGLALLAVAAVPWVHWLRRGDEGPSWWFGVAALTPIAVLSAGWWFAAPLALGAGAAHVLLALPVLLLVAMVLAFAPAAMAGWLAAGAYLAYGGPLVVAWLSGQPGATTSAVLLWHAVVALAAVAGYAVRLTVQLSARVAEAQVARDRQRRADERRAVARDVHDVVAHTLSVTMLHVTAARMAVRRGSSGAAEEALREAERHGRASLADVRRVVRVLRTDDAAPQPTLADVETLAHSYRAAGLPVDLSTSLDGAGPPAAELAVYRVLQEALANAARHGRGPATVDLRVAAGGIALTVANPAADPAAPAPPSLSTGHGLRGMAERMAAAGGTVSAGADGDHWVVRAVVPAVVPSVVPADRA